MPALDAADALRQLEAIGKKRGPPSKLVRELREQVRPCILPGPLSDKLDFDLHAALGVEGTTLAVTPA
jgi:uncharacterized protein related to proFAR isomerase